MLFLCQEISFFKRAWGINKIKHLQGHFSPVKSQASWYKYQNTQKSLNFIKQKSSGYVFDCDNGYIVCLR